MGIKPLFEKDVQVETGMIAVVPYDYLESSSKTVYAIVRDRGMQYRVEPGQLINIALREHIEQGSEIAFDEVLMVSGCTNEQASDAIHIGNPIVAGAIVRAEVVDHIKGKKIIVFRYRNKKRFRRRTGHRQRYTRVKINEIVVA
jgi:large subunit ribosomal protein L21